MEKDHQPKPEVKKCHIKAQHIHSGFNGVVDCVYDKPSPASTEVKSQWELGYEAGYEGAFMEHSNDRFNWHKDCSALCPRSTSHKDTPASTEEWEQEFKNKYDGYRNSGVGITKSDYLIEYTRSLLSSHDQQLRQRIVEGLEKMKLRIEEHHEKFYPKCERCIEIMAVNSALEDAITFITNLK